MELCARRHKAWRGGSKAQQSCVSATALEQKIMRGLSIRINQKSRKKMIKKRSKHRPESYQISIQDRPKIDRKSIGNRWEINRKSIKNLPKIHQKFIKIEAWRGSGRILAPKCVLGRIWGGSGAILEAKMVPTWFPKWSQNQ